MILQPTVHVCTKFQLRRPLSPWEKKDEIFKLIFENWRERKKKKYLKQISLCIILEWEMKKREKEGNINLSSFVYILGHSQYVYKIWRLALIEAKKLVIENSERKKNGQIKGMISSSMLIRFYTIQQFIPNPCTKFQNPRRSSSWEIFDTNFCIYYIGVRDGENGKWKKKAKINHNILVFFPTIYLTTLKVYTKFENSGSHSSREFCDENVYWRERKMDN